MQIRRDGKGQPFIEWEQFGGHHKRAWIIRREVGDERDWAKTQRYLCVVRCQSPGRPGGNPTDFPVFASALTDQQLLRAFVHAACAMTGCPLPSDAVDAEGGGQ